MGRPEHKMGPVVGRHMRRKMLDKVAEMAMLRAEIWGCWLF